MRRILPLALMLLLLAATVQAAGPQKQLPGDLTLAQAQEVLKAALFQQNGGHAAHAQIAQRAHAGSAAADDDNRGLQHGAS